MDKNKRNYMNNNVYSSHVIKGPNFATTTPGQLEVYGNVQSNTNKQITGEVPYNKGELMNILVNLDNQKQPSTNNKDNMELHSAMYIAISGIKYNPGGILLKVIDKDKSPKYVVNTALQQANLAAIQAKQNMATYQLTEMA